MAEKTIPFSYDMALAACQGWKVATTRSERKGSPGDRFFIPYPRDDDFFDCGDAIEFHILDVYPINLQLVKDKFFRLEGFTSPGEFEGVWRSLHRGHFTTDKGYFIHFFARCP